MMHRSISHSLISTNAAIADLEARGILVRKAA